jgi:hypothetical protein
MCSSPVYSRKKKIPKRIDNKRRVLEALTELTWVRDC